MSVAIGTGFTGVAQDIDQPRICFDAMPATAVVASGSAPGSDPEWVTSRETWDYWTADDATAQINIGFGAAVSIDYIGIAAHTLGSTGATVRPAFQLTDGGAYAVAPDVLAHDPTDDGAILFLFAPRAVWGVRLLISGGVSAPQIGVFQSGQALEFPRKSLYTGQPISESKSVTYRHQKSIRGDVLGRAVEGSGMDFSVDISNLPETFRAAAGDITWKGFVRHSESVGPFFIAPKPFSYPDDVAYAQVKDQPRFQRALANKAASGQVVLNCSGYVAP